MPRRSLVPVLVAAGLALAPARIAAQSEDTVPAVVDAATTTTSSVPSAVTTVPEGCPGPPVSHAVFVGRLLGTVGVEATFRVVQVRSGTLDASLVDGNVRVGYGTDVKFLDTGTTYLVGVALDPVTLGLSSTVRDSTELFGGAELAGSRGTCPSFEESARTLHLDGTSVDTGVFSGLGDSPWLLVTVVVVPPALVLAGLLAAVWWRRGSRR